MPSPYCFNHILKGGSSLVLCSLLTACLSSPDTLPRDLPSMRTIYNAHMSGESLAANARTRAAPAKRTRDSVRPVHYQGAAELKGYTRTAFNEIEQLFAPLPNPMIVLYLDPHLSQAGHPVPGYSTAFALYDKPHFALPGEVPPPARPVGVKKPGD